MIDEASAVEVSIFEYGSVSINLRHESFAGRVDALLRKRAGAVLPPRRLVQTDYEH